MTNLAIKIESGNELQLAYSALNLPVPVTYYIDDVTENQEIIETVFIDNAKLGAADEEGSWIEARILKSNLRKHVCRNELNRVYYDGSDHESNHRQEYQDMPVDEYLKVFLKETVQSYLNAGKTYITFSSAIEQMAIN
jgi:hypothetical protein